MTRYCANDPCESKAVFRIVETDTPLCYTCHEAYLWGQAGPDKTTVALEELLPTLLQGPLRQPLNEDEDDYDPDQAYFEYTELE